jgi:hypothetical protein
LQMGLRIHTYVIIALIVNTEYNNPSFWTKAGKLYIMSPFLAFTSLDRRSVRFTIPLSTIRRVERLNARAGIYALSLSTWHGMKIVSYAKSYPNWNSSSDIFCLFRLSSWLPFVQQQISFVVYCGMHSRLNYNEVKWSKLKDL